MTLLLTITLCIAVLGLLLFVFGLRRQPAADRAAAVEAGAERPVVTGEERDAADFDAAAQPARRRYGLLVTGTLLAIIGGVGTGLILNEGLESDRIDNWMLQRTPSGWLIGQLDSDEGDKAGNAWAELTRRIRSDEADDELRKALTIHYVDSLLVRDEEDKPRRVVEMDVEEGREKGWIDDKRWAGLAASSTPLRYDVPTQVELGLPLVSQLMIGLSDPGDSGWVIASFDSLNFAGQPVPLPKAVLIVPNPDWQPPAEGEEGSRGQQGGRNQRMAQATIQVPADAVASAGAGQHLYNGQFTVYAYTAELVPVPEDIRSRAAASPPSAQGNARGATTGPSTRPGDEEAAPAVLMVELSEEEAQRLIAQALGAYGLPMVRQILVIDPAAESEEPEAPQEASDQ